MESDWKPECAEVGGLSAAAIWCDGQFIPLSNDSGQPDYVVRNDIYHERTPMMGGDVLKTAREDPTQPNLSDLMSPIAPTTKFMEDGETPRPDDCAFVNEIMSHNLWGKDVNNPHQIDALDYKWGPFSMPCDWTTASASDFVKDEMEELGICNPLLGPSDPWSDPGLLSCPQETMKDYCVERAETLCDKAFSGEGINKFGPEAPPIDPYGPLPTVIIVLIFFASIAYAAYVQKLAWERKARSQKRQLEQSVSMSESRSNRVTPGKEDEEEIDMDRLSSLEERQEKFLNLMSGKKSQDTMAPSAGTIMWTTLDFEEQEMEDMFRKIETLENLVQLRYLIIMGLVVIIGYQMFLTNSRIEMQWEMRILLVTYALLILPFTFEQNFSKYEVFAEFMFSNAMIIIAVVFIFISYLDKFNGNPTESFLMMGLVIGLNTTIMFVTGTVWFRKFLTTMGIVVFYGIVALMSLRSCIGYDQFLNGDADSGVQISKLGNFYPSIQIIPDYDSFKYNMSCTQSTEDFNFIKQLMFVVVLFFLNNYTCYYWERNKRRDFGRKWALLKNKMDMEKKLKQYQEKANQSTKKKEALFGEMRELTFKSPMQKILDTIGKIRLAVGDDRPVLDALGVIDDTLKNNADLNKVDIHKAEGLDQADREIAKFILSTGGAGKQSRERGRSVPNLADDADVGSLKMEKGLGGIIAEAGHPPRCLDMTEHTAIIEALDSFEEWSFDAHKFNHITRGNPMYYIFMKHMDRFYGNNTFSLDVEAMRLFVLYAEEHYSFDPTNPNPYHTNLHSADVLQSVGAIMKSEFIQSKLGSLDRFTALVAAMMHDYRHKGVNNSFLVNTIDELALQHNDSSVLERFHASEMFQLLNNEKLDMNFTKNMNQDDCRQFRAIAIGMILATDLSQGYSYIASFKTKSQDGWTDKTEDKALLMQMILKVADVSHPTKSLNAHLIWSVYITDEFFYQGDEEKKRSMPISPLCDKVTNFDIPKSQRGFIDFVVSPTMKPVASLLKLTEMENNLKTNYLYWSTQLKEHTANNTLEKSFPMLKAEVAKLKSEWGSN